MAVVNGSLQGSGEEWDAAAAGRGGAQPHGGVRTPQHTTAAPPARSGLTQAHLASPAASPMLAPPAPSGDIPPTHGQHMPALSPSTPTHGGTASRY